MHVATANKLAFQVFVWEGVTERMVGRGEKDCIKRHTSDRRLSWFLIGLVSSTTSTKQYQVARCSLINLMLFTAKNPKVQHRGGTTTAGMSKNHTRRTRNVLLCSACANKKPEWPYFFVLVLTSSEQQLVSVMLLNWKKIGPFRHSNKKQIKRERAQIIILVTHILRTSIVEKHPDVI